MRPRHPHPHGGSSPGSPISATAIVDEAMEKTGLSDVGDDWFMAPLSAWATDLAQSNLSEFGRRFMKSLAVRDVGRRLRVLDTLRAHPEIGDVALPPIVHITGSSEWVTTLHAATCSPTQRPARRPRWPAGPPPPTHRDPREAHPRIAAVGLGANRCAAHCSSGTDWVEADDPEGASGASIDSSRRWLRPRASACRAGARPEPRPTSLPPSRTRYK